MKKLFALACTMAALSSCQSNFTYVPIVDGAPNMEMTQARCQMLSSGTQTGYMAYGSQAYVTGAAIGNAIGNAVAADQFVQQCMTMNGWRRVPLPQKASVAPQPVQPGPSQLTPEQRATFVDALGMKHVASKCGVPIKAKHRADLDRLNKLALQNEPSLVSEGRAKGEKIFAEQVAVLGRLGACKKVAEVIKAM